MTFNHHALAIKPISRAVSFALCLTIVACSQNLTITNGNNSSTTLSSQGNENTQSNKTEKVKNTLGNSELSLPILLPADIAKTVNANNQFGIEMLKQLNHSEATDKNIFYSPYSLSTAMAMLYNTAGGTTKSQIRQTFHYPSLDMLNASNAVLYQRFNTQVNNTHTNNKKREYQLTTVNDLWIKQGLKPLASFADTANTYYGAKITNLDFANQPEAARVTINDHIAKQTEQMIQNLLPPDSVKTNTSSVLTNAIYFKGEWHRPFGTSYEPLPFTRLDGSKTNVTMLQGTRQVNYHQNDTMQMIELPYRGDELSMLMILPKNSSASNMANLIDGLSTEQIDDWIAGSKQQTMELTFPKFKLSTGYQMNEVLSQMGMPLAFTTASDLTLFSNAGKHKIDGVFHKAVIEVDEKGTKAAAATGISVTPVMAVYYPEFVADHPFIFVIRDKASNTFLFIGQVNAPQ